MRIGFYGGKFMPMHKGHLYCIDTAAKMCDRLIIIMFINGDQETQVLSECDVNDETLKVYSRIEQLKHVCSLYDNVEFQIIDVRLCRSSDGSEDWDAETPLVRKFIPKMDYVFSSEPKYDAYFKRAYPEAKHVLIDIDRKTYPISSSMIRSMKNMEDKKQWIV